MKKLILIFLGGFMFASCNDAATTTSETVSDSVSTKETVTQKADYPYRIEHPDYWETGSTNNTMQVLTAIKAYENGNVEETVKYFGDSVRLQFHNMDETVSNDSLKAMFTRTRNSIKNMSLIMQDWVSVISTDKKVEYVTLWYREHWEDMNGKKDSVDVVNDLKMKGGKVIELSQYERELN